MIHDYEVLYRFHRDRYEARLEAARTRCSLQRKRIVQPEGPAAGGAALERPTGHSRISVFGRLKRLLASLFSMRLGSARAVRRG